MKYKNIDVTDQQARYYKERDKLNIALPSVAVDTLIFAQENDKLYLLLEKNDKLQLSLVGSFIKINKTLKESAIEILNEKTGLNVDHYKFINGQIYDSPNRDPRGHIIALSNYVFIEKTDVSNHEWFEVTYDQRDKIVKIKKENEDRSIYITDDYVEEFGLTLLYKDYQGHGTMIYDAVKQLNDTLYTKGLIFNVYTKGYTLTQAWRLTQNFKKSLFSRTGHRRLFEKFSTPTQRYKNENGQQARIFELKGDVE